jgi:purine-binding chemotaxis protein CheW
MDKNIEKDVFLSFKLGNELFAVSVKKVLEVLEKQQFTEIPETPDYIKGVINFRGEIVPVADTRRKFKLPPQDEKEKFVIVIMELQINEESILIGTTADAVKDVIEISNDEIKALPSMGSQVNPEFILGMVQRNDKFIMILDVDKVFSSQDIDQLSNSVIA